MLVVHGLHLGWRRPVVDTPAHHVLTSVTHSFQVHGLLLLNVVHEVDLLIVVLPTSSFEATSLHFHHLFALLLFVLAFSLLS
jgi:hypothetical protein